MFVRCLILLSFLSLNVFSHPGEFKFEHLSIEDGLSHNSVTSIIQDHKGFLWIGTNDGLNLYDGYDFRIFKADPFDSGSISSNKITKLFEDSQNRLWIGSRNGLNYFDWKTFSFKEVDFRKYQPGGSSVFVKAIYEDSRSNLWIGTYGLGLFLFDRENEQLKKIHLEYEGAGDEEDLESMVSGIYEDSRSNLWIGTSRTGIFKLDPEDYSYRFFDLDPGNRLPENSMVKTIYEDREGMLWICSELLGVFRVRTGNWQITHYEFSSNRNSLSNNIVKDIFQDDEGFIWLATDGGGVNILDPSTGNFRHLKYDISDPSSLSGNAIYTFYKDNRDILWIGTFGGGINILDPNKKPFYHFTQEESQPNSLSHPSVLTFEEDSRGMIWIGTDGGGLNLYDPETDRFKSYRHDPLKSYSISSNAVTSVFEDSFGNLWVGTFSGGLNLFDRSKNRFYKYFNEEGIPHSISNNNVWVIFETKAKQLLVGTLGGLELLDRNSMEFIHLGPAGINKRPRLERILAITEDSKGKIWIGSNILWKLDLRDTSYTRVPLVIDSDSLEWEYDVREVMEDSRGIIWIGTEGGGLLRFNEENGSFTPYTVKEGLSNNAVHEIVEDDYGFLWISTNGGLSKFNIETGEFRNYDKSDGLQSSQFSYSGSLKSSDGIMYFGGVNGFNKFDPAQIKDNKDIPPVIITDFRLFNRPVKIGDKDSPLDAHISETKQISLKHNQSVISFDFASLNYTSSQKNQYEYIMEGFESEWNEVGGQRTATYTNLDPG
ncbi:MAG: two-component regulator propeller domain-containing protein, partial [bacterium]